MMAVTSRTEILVSAAFMGFRHRSIAFLSALPGGGVRQEKEVGRAKRRRAGPNGGQPSFSGLLEKCYGALLMAETAAGVAAAWPEVEIGVLAAAGEGSAWAAG